MEATAAVIVPNTKRYLIHFIKKFKYLEFCLPEFESLVSMYCPVQTYGTLSNGVHSRCIQSLRQKLYCSPRDQITISKHPMAYANLPNEQVAKQITARSILIKEMIDVISEAKTYEGLLANVDRSKLDPILSSGKSFKFNIEGIGRKVSHKEQVEIIESFGIFPFHDNVDLKNPEIVFKILENREDHIIYFGTEVASNRIEEDTFHWKYDLKHRPYLGPTSTDSQLAFLMAN